MKELGDYLHGLGFKYGIYTDRGRALLRAVFCSALLRTSGYKTCASRPASMGHEAEDGRHLLCPNRKGVAEEPK